VGINCTAPQYILPLLESAAELARKPLLVYPNRGEGWDPVNRCWLPLDAPVDLASLALRWRKAGGRLIGGCCRTTPEDLRLIAGAVRGQGISPAQAGTPKESQPI